jgi:hypothetical protein
MKVFITFICSVILSACGSGGSGEPSPTSDIEKVLQTPIGSVAVSEKVLQTTPKGVLVYSESGVEPLLLDEVDKGVTELHIQARMSGFRDSKIIMSDDIEIFIPPFACIDGSFLLNAGGTYDGSSYDRWNPKGYGVKDGKSVITAAEKVLSFGTQQGENAKLYVCPEVLKLGTQYGLEHIYLSRFSYTEENRLQPPYDGISYFQNSLNHSGGISHPLLPRIVERVY